MSLFFAPAFHWEHRFMRLLILFITQGMEREDWGDVKFLFDTLDTQMINIRAIKAVIGLLYIRAIIIAFFRI